jgi:hypothetical protein
MPPQPIPPGNVSIVERAAVSVKLISSQASWLLLPRGSSTHMPTQSGKSLKGPLKHFKGTLI